MEVCCPDAQALSLMFVFAKMKPFWVPLSFCFLESLTSHYDFYLLALLASFLPIEELSLLSNTALHRFNILKLKF